VPTPNRIVCPKAQSHSCPYQETPIKGACGRGWSSRKELEYPAHDEKAQCKDVDGVAGFTEAESRRRE